MYSTFPGNCNVSYLSFVYGRSIWAELDCEENSLHWKANMLPLFSIMTLWHQQPCTLLQNSTECMLTPSTTLGNETVSIIASQDVTLHELIK